MKVLNLCCSSDHRFEGWFASEDDYCSQAERGLVECPLCGDNIVQRLPSAPHLLTSASRGVSLSQRERSAPSLPLPSEEPIAGIANASGGRVGQFTLQSAWLRAVQHVITHTDDVGTQFAEEVRRMHYGETDERPIRGQATFDEAKALHEEGIEVMALQMPVAIKGTVQ